MELARDLFNIERYIQPNAKPLNERAGAIKFFELEGFKHKDGSLFTGEDLGIRCAHLKLDHLYMIQSEYKDIKNRKGYDAAAKYFMGATKTVRVGGPSK